MMNSGNGIKKLMSYYFTRKPALLVYFITKRCNADCLFCFNKGKRENKELSIDEIEKITKSMFPLYWLLISGGEPFLRDDLDRIIGMFRENAGVNYTQVPTNGYLTERIVEKTAAITESFPGMKLVIAVSLDAIGEKHDRMRQLTGCYERAVETIRRLVALKETTPHLGVSINMTLSHYNQEKIIEYYDYFKNNFNVDSVKVGYVRGDVANKEAIEVSDECFNRYRRFFLNELKKSGARGFIPRILRSRDRFLNDMISDIIKTDRMPLSCKAGIHSLVMYEDGNIHACEILRKTIGNIRDYHYDFREFWNSEKATGFRKWRKTCVCTYECALTTSILYNLKSIMKIFFSSLHP
jgi:MoaA/NifB/PqqE/SkfB family radical SAM enzyme